MPLPTLEFPLASGLYTKARQDDVSALLTAQNVDYFAKAGGIGKVPGTQRRSNTPSPAASWQSLHHHDGRVAGTLTRMQVGVNGTTLRQIATDQSLSTLKSGLTAEPMFGVSSQDRLQLASANNTPVKVTLGSVVSNWGIAVPSSAPTATKGASGNVPPGGHRYVVTYVTTYGKESNRSSPSATVLSTGSQVSLTSIPVSSEAQVTQRKIYRDDQGDALYRFVATINDNSTTTYTDNASNADLSSVTAPEAGGAVDNSSPDNMAFVWTHETYIFGVLADDRKTVMWTEANEPEYWPTLNTRTFHTEVSAGIPTLGGSIIFGSDWMVQVTGGEGGSRTLQFNEGNPELGCVGPRAVCRAKQATFLIHDDGPHLTTSGVDDWYLGTPIRDQIDDLDASSFASSILVYQRERYRVLWFVDGEVFVYNFGNQGTGQVSPEGVGVDPLDLRLGKWTRMELPDDYSVTSAAIVETAADTPELWLGASDAVVYRSTTSVANFGVGSLSEAIVADVKTTFEKVIADDDREGRGRFLTIEGNGTAASTWTATLTFSQDANGGGKSQSVSRSVVIGPGSTSKKYAVPRGYQGVYCQLRLQNSTAGETGVIEKAKLHFIPTAARGER